MSSEEIEEKLDIVIPIIDEIYGNLNDLSVLRKKLNKIDIDDDDYDSDYINLSIGIKELESNIEELIDENEDDLKLALDLEMIHKNIVKQYLEEKF